MYQVLLVILLAVTFTSGRQFENPIIRGKYAAYSSVAFYNGYYYLVVDTDGFELEAQFPIYQSADLQNWGLVGYVFPTVESLPTWLSVSEKKVFYAPKLIVLGENNFRVYFTAGYTYYKIGVAFATNILGPYVSTSKPLIEDPKYRVSEAEVLIDNGVLRVYWRLWNTFGIIQGKSLTADGLNVSSENASTLITPELKWENSMVGFPDVIKRNNLYYIFYSASSGGIGVARSSQPYGGFVKRSDPILAPVNGRTPSDPTVIQDIDGVNLVIIYIELYYPVGSSQYTKVQMAKSLSWDADGWPYVS